MEKKIIAIISCYYGELPSYYGKWLESCGRNNYIDFIFITDCKTIDYNVPDNVAIKHIPLEKLKSLIEEKISLKPCIESAYKLTDFKVAYGKIFEDMLIGYSYWGYCDIDLIFGNIGHFLNQEVLSDYDKFYKWGHFTVYRNNETNKMLYTKPGGVFHYREVFSKKNFYSFDEQAGMIAIAKHNGVSTYYEEDCADISYRINRLTAARQKNYEYQVFYSEDGSIYRAFIDADGKVRVQEYMYIHFSKRRFNHVNTLTENFYILSDGFHDKKNRGIPNYYEVVQYSEHMDTATEKKERRRYMIVKIRAFLNASMKDKVIWIKQMVKYNAV